MAEKRELKNIRISNGFQVGLLGGLGVLTALVLGGAIATLAQVITYVFAAMFIALGLDPIVSLLERKGLKRPLAILAVIVALLGVLAGILLALVPNLIDQAANLIVHAPEVIRNFKDQAWVVTLNQQVGGQCFR